MRSFTPSAGTAAARRLPMTIFRLFVAVGVVLGVMAACGGDVDVFGGSTGSAAQGSGAGNSTSTTGGSCDCARGAYVPVCGVDGRTYDATCGEQCVPVEIACQGECPCPTCDTLHQQYLEAIDDAQVCDPGINLAQCTLQLDDQLACPCPTFVNPSNAAAIRQAQSLQAQWDALGCSAQVNCPAVECIAPMSASCVANSIAIGACIDDIPQGGG